MMKRFMLAVSCLSLSACMMADDLHVSGNLSDVGNDTLIAMTYLNNSVDQTMKVLAKDCFVDGDRDLVDDDSLFLFGLMGQLSKIIEMRHGRLVNLSKPGK